MSPDQCWTGQSPETQVRSDHCPNCSRKYNKKRVFNRICRRLNPFLKLRNQNGDSPDLAASLQCHAYTSEGAGTRPEPRGAGGFGATGVGRIVVDTGDTKQGAVSLPGPARTIVRDPPAASLGPRLPVPSTPVFQGDRAEGSGRTFPLLSAPVSQRRQGRRIGAFRNRVDARASKGRWRGSHRMSTPKS
jgi:hypothetical protein